MRSSKQFWMLLAVCFLLYPLGASAQDADKYWTTAGSTGTLDEKSEGKVSFDGAKVEKGFVVQPPTTGNARLRTTDKGGAEVPDSAVIRYNVTAVDGLFGVKGAFMAVRFLAEEGAHVTARLIQVDIAGGIHTTLLTFDGDIAPALGYHRAEVCEDGVVFDFVHNAYYIEATLTTNSILPSSLAGIEVIQLNATECIRS